MDSCGDVSILSQTPRSTLMEITLSGWDTLMNSHSSDSQKSWADFFYEPFMAQLVISSEVGSAYNDNIEILPFHWISGSMNLRIDKRVKLRWLDRIETRATSHSRACDLYPSYLLLRSEFTADFLRQGVYIYYWLCFSGLLTVLHPMRNLVNGQPWKKRSPWRNKSIAF